MLANPRQTDFTDILFNVYLVSSSRTNMKLDFGVWLHTGCLCFNRSPGCLLDELSVCLQRVTA